MERRRYDNQYFYRADYFMKNIMIVDDDVSICESLRFALSERYNLHIAYEPNSALEIYLSNDIDVIILDLKLGKYDGLELYNNLRNINPKIPVIIITAYGTIKSSIEAIKKGVFNYMTKPIDLNELEVVIEKALEFNKLNKKVEYLSEELYSQYQSLGVVAKSKSMTKVLERVEKVKNINSNVLITGESGTGKEVIARNIHYQGNRKDEKFIAINCSAIPANLLESELFGYTAGSFTGANKNKKGLFEIADKGTLFLDEIGDLDIELQGKLLRVLQEKEVTPIGSGTPIRIDVRLISATNRNLEELIKENKFREDLFYRLNVINIWIPPLRERKEDIPYLINHFIKKYNQEIKKNVNKVSPAFLECLINYDFKGNIRELENIMESTMALTDKEILDETDLIGRGINIFTNSFDKGGIIYIKVGESLKDIEKKVILKTYETLGNNKKEAAKVLGISERTVREKLKEYNIDKQ